jgi:hypothetical protein
MYIVSNVRQIEIHTAEPLVPDPNPSEVEIVIANLKKYKSPGSDQILEDWFKQEEKHYSMTSINSLILLGVRKDCLISERSPLLHQFTRRVIKTMVINEEYN